MILPMTESRLWLFLSTPSARRATRAEKAAEAAREISIHALREEGDTIQSVDKTSTQSFLSTPSARRATRQAFQVQKYYEISIHALREEGDLGRGSSKQSMANFYPRPPRGGRQFFPVLPEQSIGFLSTPSARRATLCGRIRNQKDIRFLSTPSARRATGRACCFQPASSYFYPRPLRGGRRPRLSTSARRT